MLLFGKFLSLFAQNGSALPTFGGVFLKRARFEDIKILLNGEQRNVPLFDYVRSSIEWLDGAEKDFANFHLVFLMRLSRFLGFYPNLEDYSLGDCFDLRESTFCPAPPPHHDFLQSDEAAKLQLMMRMDFPTMHLYQLSRHDRNRLLEVAITYYRLHLPSFPELKSLTVLRELYA